ncbi:hypothetical protein CEXT_547721 [Caerostris extrusa]|uniref:Uncharacterized protein n=1 Tax=Caerostris extrusa TaxID=172846 RepID=A0AAV4S858_CAEEX|nr:hypothetical protein CEXT_547721 [Caerostris extrusa]
MSSLFISYFQGVYYGQLLVYYLLITLSPWGSNGQVKLTAAALESRVLPTPTVYFCCPLLVLTPYPTGDTNLNIPIQIYSDDSYSILDIFDVCSLWIYTGYFIITCSLKMWMNRERFHCDARRRPVITNLSNLRGTLHTFAENPFVSKNVWTMLLKEGRECPEGIYCV